MRFKIPRLRPVGVAAVAALTAGTAFAGLTATPAAAASPPAGTVVAASQPHIVAGTTNQPAGNWAITVNATTFAAGDRIVLSVADNAGNNCTSPTDIIAFHAVPTVTNVTTPAANNTATFNVATASSAPCAAQTGSPKDLLVITFTNGSNTGVQQTLAVSGVAYDVTTGVAGGPVVINANGCAAADATCAAPTAFTTGAGASNATIDLVSVTANTPPTGIPPNTNGNSISNIVLTEAQGGALKTTNFVCLAIIAPEPNGPGYTPTSTPTVTTNGNGATVNNGAGGPNGTSSGVTLSENSNGTGTTPPLTFLFFQVNTQSSPTTPATYTISGLKLDTRSATGAVIVRTGQSATLSTACTTGNVAAQTVITAIVGINRIGGADRYGTAAQLFSPFGTACSSNGLNAVLARGDLFADALSASYLAGSLFQGNGDHSFQGTGILLTQPTALPDVTMAALRQAGVTDVFIVGQTSAVSQAVEDQLKATPAYVCGGSNVLTGSTGQPVMLKVTRIGGADRYATAQDVAQTPNPARIGTADLDGDTLANPVRTAVVARGDAFPDALAASPMAFFGNNVGEYAEERCNDSAVSECVAGNGNSTWGTGKNTWVETGNIMANGFPLVLTTPSSLSPAASAALLNDGIKQVIVMGGTAAVSDATASQITALGISVIREGGTDRTDTAAKAAGLETGTFADLPTGTADCNIFAVAPAAPTCTKPNGLFYRTDHVNVARGDDAGGGADALSGGPHAAGIDNAQEFGFSGVRMQGPTPVLLTLDPNTLGATHDYLAAHSAPAVVNFDVNPDGGVTTADIFGQTAAITAATATAVQNALTGA